MKSVIMLPAAVLAMQMSEEHGTSMSIEHDIESMKELFLGISKSKIDGATRRFVDEMMTNISTTLQEAIESDMNLQQYNLRMKHEDLDRCLDNRNRNVETYDIAGLAATTEGKKDAHSECRVAQQGFCDDVVNYGDTCDEQAIAISQCERPLNGFANADLYVLQWIECIHRQKAAAAELCATHTSLSQSCKKQTEKDAECDTAQGTFEVEMCSWQTTVDEVCYRYDRCYDGAEEWIRRAKAQAAEAWDLATTQKRALLMLRCYGEAILANATDLSHCDQVECVAGENCPADPCDARHCPPLPPREPCAERERQAAGGGKEGLPRPCEETFLAEQYGSLQQCSAATDCITCHDVHYQPFYFVGHGQCLCQQGFKLSDIEGPGPVTSAYQCTQWCQEARGCHVASYNANTNECIGLRDFGNVTREGGEGWSCYSNFAEDEYKYA